MRLHCIDDNVPEKTVRLLEAASQKRGIPFIRVRASGFDYDASRRALPGDLIYRPAVSLNAQRVEQFIAHPLAATFHREPDGMHFGAANAPLLHARAGLPVPRFFYCQGPDRALLLEQAEAVGGFPVVLKVPGASRGIGVMRVDSAEALVSLVDYALASNQVPMLMPYIDPAVHWRVVVVGDRAVAAYRNPRDAHDFRTYGSTDPADFTASPDAALAELAVRAVRALRLELGGVDILEHESGRLYLLESNFPLYHPHAEEVAGIDISGAMVEHLMEKASRLLEAAGGAQAAAGPRLEIIDGFADEATCEALLQAADPQHLAAQGIAVRRDITGLSCELPVAGNALLAGIAARMSQRVGVHNARGETLRFRRYEAGNSHPVHSDRYVIEGHRLVATALLYLEQPVAGGETRFPNARPVPVDIAPRRGRLAWWFNYLPDGRPDITADHLSAPVLGGSKAVLAQFFYSADRTV